MNTYIISITYKDGYTEEFEVMAANLRIALDLVADYYEIDFNDVAEFAYELKENEE